MQVSFIDVCVCVSLFVYIHTHTHIYIYRDVCRFMLFYLYVFSLYMRISTCWPFLCNYVFIVC